MKIMITLELLNDEIYIHYVKYIKMMDFVLVINERVLALYV